MADSKVGILIEAKDNASSTIKNVKGTLNDFGKTAGDVTSLSGAFTSLGTAVGLAGVAFGAIKVGEKAIELAQYSAQVQRAETAFATFSQQAGLATNTLDMLRSASRGTISDFDLMQSSSRALALGVADSSQELTQLLEVAIARGKALGVSANQAFSDLVTGIGRMSPLILDNLVSSLVAKSYLMRMRSVLARQRAHLQTRNASKHLSIRLSQKVPLWWRRTQPQAMTTHRKSNVRKRHGRTSKPRLVKLFYRMWFLF